MDRGKVRAAREYLEEELRKARRELAQLDDRLESRGDYGLGKGDPLIVRWELNLALKDDMEQKVEALEEALQRLDEGDYGICESCGQAIDPARLRVLPRTSMCIECARKAEQDGLIPASTTLGSGR
jgi:DnaK suppressor protein